MSKDNREEKNEKRIGKKEVCEVMQAAFGSRDECDYPHLLYLLNCGYNAEACNAIVAKCSRRASFDELDAIAQLYRVTRSFDKGAFAKLVKKEFGKTFSIPVLNEVSNCLNNDIGFERVNKLVRTHENDEETLLTSLRFARRAMQYGFLNDVFEILVHAKSKEALILSFELYQRGSSEQVILSILIRYAYSDHYQVNALKKEVIKEKMSGSIRDRFKYYA